MEGDGAPACAPPAGDGEDGARCPARAVEPLPGRGRSLLGNWQEERATEDLDRVPRPECGSEGSFFRHGHRGLLTLQSGASLADRTTMKDSYRRPRRPGLPQRGKREAMMVWLLAQKHRKEILEEVEPPCVSMVPLSTMHQDYRWEGSMSAPPAPTQPHDYRLEQPQTFWREYAQQLPGVSRDRTGDASFKKCAMFTTPVSEYLDLPWPYNPESLAK